MSCHLFSGNILICFLLLTHFSFCSINFIFLKKFSTTTTSITTKTKIIIIIIIFTLLRVFHTRFSWWVLSKVWVIASLLKSPGLFSVLWSITIMMLLDGLLSPSYFKVFQYLYQTFGDLTERTNYTWYYHHFHVPEFFKYRVRSRHLSLISLSVLPCGHPEQQSPQFSKFPFLLWTIPRSGCLTQIMWFQRILRVSFSRTDSGLCIYHLFVWYNLNLHNSQWIALPIQSCLV